MEVVVAKALKPSLRRELNFQQQPLALAEEILCFNANNNNGVVGGGEDFSVDDLLDFSSGEFQHVGKGIDIFEEIEEDLEDEEKDRTSSESSQDHIEEDSNSNSTGAADSDSIFAGELAVPEDDLADLEWVSHFVDDSIPELSLMYPVRSEPTRARAEPEPKLVSVNIPPLRSEVPVKARTTKTRKPNRRFWTFIAMLSPPSSPSSCSSVLSSTVVPVFAGEPPAKKQKRKPEAQAFGPQFQRRCTHCQVQKTPQWRTGPLGPKTLCNACGVRYKSGRLFPEYRPACSPTFSGDIHSNSHRKVLEMRRRKEMTGLEPGLDRVQMIPSC